MRTRTILIGALLLASAVIAQAQAQEQQQTTGQAGAPARTIATPASSFQPQFGKVDFGYRGNAITGDEARYNRFRDRRDGAYVSRFLFTKETANTFFTAEANNIGYRDQRYFGEFQSIGRLKANFEWNQVPLFLSNTSSSLYTDLGNGVLGINDAIQQTLQNAGTVPAVRDPALANAMATAQPFDLYSRRDIGAFNMVYTFNRDVDFKVKVRNTLRSGNQLFAFGFGTSPGLNPAVEMGVPVDDRTTDIKGVLEFANAKGLFSVGYDGSWFDNNVPFVRFDNPLRATDIAGGGSVGLAAWWPANSAFSVNVNGAYKLPGRTRASAALSMGRWEQDAELPAPTVNTALVAPPLPRSTAATRADITSFVFGLNSRPVDNLRLTARYRLYDYDNKSTPFAYGSETAPVLALGDWALVAQRHETEPASFKRGTLDLDASFTPLDYVALGVGVSREDADRTWRIFEKTAENMFRVTADSLGNQYFTVRAKYERSTREGEGFQPALLAEVGEQLTMQHYDIADRNRTRFSTMLTLTPVSAVSLNASIGTGKDDYENSGFGLRDNTNDFWSAGFDVVPNDRVTLGVNYGSEKYEALQYSRQTSLDPATPAGQEQFADPKRDWWLNQDDEVKTLTANLDLNKALPKTDLRLGYDRSDGKASYRYGFPADSTIFTSVPLSQLTPLKNRLTAGRFDVQHFVRPNVALGLRYLYEEYKVEDFALGAGTIDRLDARNGNTNVFASAIYAGYLFQPYKAHNWSLRMTYLW